MLDLFMLLNFYSYVIFIPLIFISSILIFISNSWFSQWMIMEINLIGFMSLIIFEKKINSSVPMNYFLIQVFNSYMFIMLSMNLNFMNLFLNSIFYFLINLNMLTKMGLPPFYLWYIKVMSELNYMNFFLLMTIQKIIPLMILNNLSMMNNLFVMKFNMLNLLIMSMLCSLLGLQTMNLKILLSYSSIIQMTWMIMLMYLNEIYMYMYMLIYVFISLILIMILNKFNLKFLNNLNLLKFQYNWIYCYYFMVWMSMASIPPFFGFLMKWISIQIMSFNFNFMLILLMIFNSLISMYFYLRIIFISFMNKMFSIKKNYLMVNYSIKLNYKLIYLNWFMFFMLMIYELI